ARAGCERGEVRGEDCRGGTLHRRARPEPHRDGDEARREEVSSVEADHPGQSMTDEKKSEDGDDVLAAWALLREMDCPRTPDNFRRSLLAVKSFRVSLREGKQGS